MSQAEVKEAIIDRVHAVSDVGALSEILEFVEGWVVAQENDGKYPLTEAQMASIQRGLDDVAAGRVVSHEEAMTRCRNRSTR